VNLMKREPYRGLQPHMVVNVKDNTDIFSLAKNYQKEQLLVEGYTEYHDAMKIEQAL